MILNCKFGEGFGHLLVQIANGPALLNVLRAGGDLGLGRPVADVEPNAHAHKDDRKCPQAAQELIFKRFEQSKPSAGECTTAANDCMRR